MSRAFAKDVSDAEIARHMEPVLKRLGSSVRGTPASVSDLELANPTPPAKDRAAGSTYGTSDQKPSMSDELKRFLASIDTHPLLCATARRDHLGETSDRFGSLKREALDGGLVEDYSVNLGAQAGGIVRLTALTVSGLDALGKRRAAPAKTNVSREHFFWQQQLCRFLRQDAHEAEIEKCLDGKRADVGLKRSDGWHAYEVAISPNNETVNAQRDLEAGFVSVTIGCKNSAVLRVVTQKIEAHLSAQQHQHVSVKLLSDLWFVPRLLSEIRGHGS